MPTGSRCPQGSSCTVRVTHAAHSGPNVRPEPAHGTANAPLSSLGPCCPKGMFTLGHLNEVRCLHQMHYGHNIVDLSTG